MPFPSNPSNNATYVNGGKKYIYSSSKGVWSVASSGSAAIPGVLTTGGGQTIDGTLTVTGNAGVGNLTVTGNLTVNGTTTTINTTTLDVTDLNITVAKGAINAAQANGAGITVDGINASIVYNNTSNSWVFNRGITFPDGSAQTSAGASTGKAIAMAMVFS